MTVFDKYALYYNLFYRDKKYAEEADYIDQLIRKYNPDASTILDLGCGTGQHDLFLAEKGFQVTGVDRSEEMLRAARQRKESSNKPGAANLRFHHGDVRNFRFPMIFDVVISLFHVISYQPTNADLQSAFDTAAAHLKPEGIFIFDCWYGPGVLQDPPAVRIKELEDDNISVTRIAEPVVFLNENIVDVNYHIFIRQKANKNVDEIRECHRLRYLFKPEVQFFLEYSGFDLLTVMEFMKETLPQKGNWNVCFIGQKRKS